MRIIHLGPHLLRDCPAVHKSIDREHQARSERACFLALPHLIGQGMAVAQHMKAAKEVDGHLAHLGRPQIEHRFIRLHLLCLVDHAPILQDMSRRDQATHRIRPLTQR